jgi:imidazolonepropionase-like amidohydrolase
MSPHLPLLTVALAAATVSMSASAAPAAEPVALQCERLFDARAGRLLGAHTVTVRDGRIAEVRAGRVEVPGVRAIDLAGHTCTPGWTDLHVHMAQQSSPSSYEEEFRLDDLDFAYQSVGYARKTLQAGFTSVRDLGGHIAPHLPSTAGSSKARGSWRPASRSPPPAAMPTRPMATTARCSTSSARRARRRAW